MVNRDRTNTCQSVEISASNAAKKDEFPIRNLGLTVLRGLTMCTMLFLGSLSRDRVRKSFPLGHHEIPLLLAPSTSIAKSQRIHSAVLKFLTKNARTQHSQRNLDPSASSTDSSIPTLAPNISISIRVLDQQCLMIRIGRSRMGRERCMTRLMLWVCMLLLITRDEVWCAIPGRKFG